MKKSLVALATMSVVSSAFADIDISGGVKMYGTLDQGAVTQNLQSADTNITSNYSGMFAANATSRLGFKGARDLGDGFKGIFQAEIQLDPDTATLLPTKNRTAFVGLQGAFGSIMGGTMETAAYEVFGMDVNGRIEYKPQVWRTTTSLDLQDRANNSIKYISPEFGGFTLHFQQSFNEIADTTSVVAATANTYAQLTSYSIKYQKDKLRAAFVHDETKNALMGYKFAGLSNAGPSTTGTTSYNLYYGTPTTLTNGTVQRDIASVSYNFDSFSVNYLFAKSYQTGTYAASNTTSTFGVKVPFDKLTLALSYGTGTVDSAYTSTTAVIGSTGGLGRATDGSLSDTTVGIYYNFDKSTSAYFLGSQSTSSVGLYDGSNKTFAMGARYNF